MSSRIRREPPAFRRLAVRAVEQLTPRMKRVVLAGDELDGFSVDAPAASVRMLLPSPGTNELVMPTWRGNEFLLPDGSRPAIRTFTPLRADGARRQLQLEVVMHGRGVASEWAEAAAVGDAVAISGPGRGYVVDDEAPSFFLAGDETAIPAMSQLLEVLPPGAAVDVRIEVADAGARMVLPEHPGAAVEWCELPADGNPGDLLLAAARDAAFEPATRVWVAGEAAGVQRVRRHLFEERGLTRAQATVRGYWKHGRSGGSEDDA